jgi:hypothetical protein
MCSAEEVGITISPDDAFESCQGRIVVIQSVMGEERIVDVHES